MTNITHFFVLVMCLGAHFTFGQNQLNSLPGDTSLPSSAQELARLTQFDQGNHKYPLEAYFKRAEQSGFQISPEGNYLSYLKKAADGHRSLYVRHLRNGQEVKVLEEQNELILMYAWKNENKLIYMQDQGGNEQYHLFSVDRDGSNARELTPFEGVTMNLLAALPDQPNHLIISMNKENPMLEEAYRINIDNGTLEKVVENTDPEHPIVEFLFDRKGNRRGYWRYDNGSHLSLFYYKNNQQITPDSIMSYPYDECSFSIQEFDETTAYPHDVIVSTDQNRDNAVLVRYDLIQRKVLDTLFSHAVYGVEKVDFAGSKRHFELDYVRYEGEKKTIVPFSHFYKKLAARIESAFPGMNWNVESTDRREQQMILLLESDRQYGIYYRYDVQRDQFDKLAALRPELDEKDMAPMLPFSFKSRDGVRLYGYLTVPLAMPEGRKPALIVNPHGGPFGIRDHWEFNPEVQLFASRGYAVLQVNYRGSGGYGKAFEQSGKKQVGRKMLEDIEDGVAYLIQQKWIDSTRIAVYGASYGGLATLQSLMNTPERYVCGVDYVGVSNLFTQLEQLTGTQMVYAQWYKDHYYDPEIAEERAWMEAASPALNAEKLTRPLLVVQGANDPRVKIAQSDEIVRNLRRRGIEVPYLVKYDEGHGFAHEENQMELYHLMLGFFKKYLN